LTDLEARIVVVDDAPDALEMLVELIACNGYAVRGASDGAQALELVSQFTPHCVLFDVQMPGMDGLTLARNLRAAHGNDLVLIAVTGHSPDDSRVAETFDAVDYWFTKPIDLDRLHQVLPPIAHPDPAAVA
jgi:DNA-binding response OmpR family regulator